MYVCVCILDLILPRSGRRPISYDDDAVHKSPVLAGSRWRLDEPHLRSVDVPSAVQARIHHLIPCIAQLGLWEDECRHGHGAELRVVHTKGNGGWIFAKDAHYTGLLRTVHREIEQKTL